MCSIIVLTFHGEDYTCCMQETVDKFGNELPAEIVILLILHAVYIFFRSIIIVYTQTIGGQSLPI